MAVDTRLKRSSCLGLIQPNLGKIWPHPDGSLATAGDRQLMGYSYAGAAVPIIVTIFDGLGTSIRLTGVGH